ncbi:MAG: hypothetical protein ABR577_00875, partial [Pyrinomonadaceae bacterium]
MNSKPDSKYSALAAQLVAANDDAERFAMLKRHHALADVRLAYALKDACYDSWNSEPTNATGAAAALRALAQTIGEPEAAALALWIGGIASLVGGEMPRAIAQLDEAAQNFRSLGKEHAAASTQVSKLVALAMLGRYDEAIACGLVARDVLLAHRDTLAAGKIEHNIGNIYWRRDLYDEAEQYLTPAHEKFLAAD